MGKTHKLCEAVCCVICCHGLSCPHPFHMLKSYSAVHKNVTSFADRVFTSQIKLK